MTFDSHVPNYPPVKWGTHQKDKQTCESCFPLARKEAGKASVISDFIQSEKGKRIEAVFCGSKARNGGFQANEARQWLQVYVMANGSAD